MSTQNVNSQFLSKHVGEVDGPSAFSKWSNCPTAKHSTFDAQTFRILLLRRLWLPSHHPAVFTGVAVHSISVATTVRIAVVVGPGEPGAALPRSPTRVQRAVAQTWMAARRLKERRFPELSGRFGRTRLVVLGAEVGGKWSNGTVQGKRSSRTSSSEGQCPARVVVSLEEHACLQHKSVGCPCWTVGTQCVWTATPTTSDVNGDCRHFVW